MYSGYQPPEGGYQLPALVMAYDFQETDPSPGTSMPAAGG